MKLRPLALPVLLAAALSYYIYTPLPAGLEEPWKLMVLDAVFRTTMHVASLKHLLGLDHYLPSVRRSVEAFDGFAPAVLSAEPSGGGVLPGVKVTDLTFAGVPVRLYEPPAGGDGHLRRGLVYFHGGGWALGSAKQTTYDRLNSKLCDELDTVVVSVEYRLSPEVHFPVPYLDCLTAAKHFLSADVLSRYAVDPERVAVAGDSAGGNLAAAVSQEVSRDDGLGAAFSVQALIYPVLQTLDFNTPSYVQNQNAPVLTRTLMVQFWLQYLNADLSLVPQLLANNHSAVHPPTLPPDVRSRVDWSALLPPKYRKKQRPLVAARAASRVLKEVPGLLDVRAAPLLAAPDVLTKSPRTFILTCEHDVLRDDGLMYARRLKDAGVSVTSEHLEDGFHGCFTMTSWPLEFQVGHRAVRLYLDWLHKHL